MSDEPLLRPWRTSDAPALLRHARSAADVARELPELGDVAAARALIEQWTAQDTQGLGWHLAIVQHGVAIGAAGIGQVHRGFAFGWLGYWMAPSGRGRGWTKRAAATVADWALHRAPAPLFRVESGCRVGNEASAHILEAAGFQPEGVERGKLCYSGRRHDAVRYSRLATDPDPRIPLLALEG